MSEMDDPPTQSRPFSAMICFQLSNDGTSTGERFLRRRALKIREFGGVIVIHVPGGRGYIHCWKSFLGCRGLIDDGMGWIETEDCNDLTKGRYIRDGGVEERSQRGAVIGRTRFAFLGLGVSKVEITAIDQ